MKATPWAILLCQFKDDVAPDPYPRARFEEIFTIAGTGKFNMVDYFRDMSHQRVDLSGSHVFPSAAQGWYTLTQNRSDYKGRDSRNDLLAWAKQAAASNGDNISGFFNVVVVMKVPTDLFGGLNGVATDDGRDHDIACSSLSPSRTGQEMGHGYGLNHSRIEGSGDDYKDDWDIMSTLGGTHMAPHPVYTERDVRGRPIFLIGPGLNAANMYAMDWLDPNRTFVADTHEHQTTFQLRPLHRLDLPGYLCARYGDLFLEFRMNDRWDAGLPQPVVLIHDYFDGNSYIYTGHSGTPGLVAGDYYGTGDISDEPHLRLDGGLKISVTVIDPDSQTATIEIKAWKGLDLKAGPAVPFGAVTQDGGGRVFVNGRWIRIPPRSPLLSILENVAEAQLSQSIRHGLARAVALQQAYHSIAETAQKQADEITSFRVPSGRVQPRERNR